MRRCIEGREGGVLSLVRRYLDLPMIGFDMGWEGGGRVGFGDRAGSGLGHPVVFAMYCGRYGLGVVGGCMLCGLEVRL